MFDREHNLVLIKPDDIVLDERFGMDLYHKGNGYEWVIKEYQWGVVIDSPVHQMAFTSDYQE